MTAVSGGDGVAFVVSYGVVAEIIAKACSSPQTVHLNAGKRAETLMLWVNIGVAESIAVIAIAAWVDSKVPGKNHTAAIVWGGALAIAVTYAEYWYAKKRGLNERGPTTENY
jgi:uncharacterized protein YcfL